MKTESQCGCNAVPAERYIALACSGASDLGELADRVCRKLRSEMPDTSMNCLAKLGFGEQSLRDAIDKDKALVIDGCPIDCGKKIMEKNDITNFKHIRLTDFGYVKGQTQVTADTIAAASCKVLGSL